MSSALTEKPEIRVLNAEQIDKLRKEQGTDLVSLYLPPHKSMANARRGFKSPEQVIEMLKQMLQRDEGKNPNSLLNQYAAVVALEAVKDTRSGTGFAIFVRDGEAQVFTPKDPVQTFVLRVAAVYDLDPVLAPPAESMDELTHRFEMSLMKLMRPDEDLEPDKIATRDRMIDAVDRMHGRVMAWLR